MISSKVTKRALRFPFINNQNTPVAAGIPGHPLHGTNARMTSTTWQQFDTSGPGFPMDQVSQIVQIPRPDNEMPLRAITIASDSSIAQCDISFGGDVDMGQIYRVGVGAPLVGEFKSDFISVSLPIPIPHIAAFTNNDLMWNGVQAGAFPNTLWGADLKLDFWWGDALSMLPNVRAPMHGWVLFRLATPTNKTCHFVVDGRKRIKVFADTAGGTTPTITLRESNVLRVAGTVDDQNIFRAITGPTAIASGVPYNFEIGDVGAAFPACPMPILSVTITEPTGMAADLELHVYAWD